MGKEPMIIIFGNNPAQVIEKILLIQWILCNWT
jgi:predicted fused transcriptional regulator/phosphomethylpyrimidine kinase